MTKRREYTEAMWRVNARPISGYLTALGAIVPYVASTIPIVSSAEREIRFDRVKLSE